MKSTPLIKLVDPKLNLGNPPTGSIPIEARSKPIKAMIKPLIGYLPEIPEIIDNPKNAKANVSGALNLRANSANFGAIKIRIITLNIPPIAEEIVDTVSAFSPYPCLANGYPSSAVAADDGVPGVFKSIAATDPPYIAPK